MKKSNLARLFPLFITVVFTAVTFMAHAQAQKHVFKTGDRVLASPLSLKDDKYWRAGTVTEVHNFSGRYAYSITCDPETKGGSSSSFLVNGDWVKPLSANDDHANKNDNTQTQAGVQHTTPTNTAQQQHTTVACPHSDPDTKGKTAFEQSLRGAIRTDFEREPQAGMDGRVTVTFQNLSIGQSHGYRVYEDPNEAKGRNIYPVRATFTTCTDYNRRIVVMKRERAFSCYQNTAGKWVCDVTAAANTNVKDEEKSIDKVQ